jgi:acetyl-CoA acetyltransferase
MPKASKRDSAAVTGVGMTPLSRIPDRNEVQLGVDACRMAAEDAGLDPALIDGINIQVHHFPPPETLAIAQGLGMRQIAWLQDGGPLGIGGVGAATEVIESGRASAVVVCKIMNTVAPVNTPAIDPGTGEVDGDQQWEVPYGLGYTMQRTGLFARRYMTQYNISEEQLGTLAVVERENAVRTPYAFQKKLITLEDYLNSRWIAEPVRLLDCDLPVNGAFAFLVVRGDIAKSLRQPPVWVVGWGEEPGNSFTSDNVPTPVHLLPLPGKELVPAAQILYRDTGMRPSDMDMAFPYDGFSFFVPVWMEHLGLLPRGEAGAFIGDGSRIRPDGELPINTHGGNLSAGRAHAHHHVIEAVEQLRGTAGPRQVKKPVNFAVLAAGLPSEGFTGILAREP